MACLLRNKQNQKQSKQEKDKQINGKNIHQMVQLQNSSHYVMTET